MAEIGPAKYDELAARSIDFVSVSGATICCCCWGGATDIAHVQWLVKFSLTLGR